MLILSRKCEQSIVIQGGITIKILEIEGDRVKLGISAPAGVRVVRAELLDAVRIENLAATAGQAAGESVPTSVPISLRRVLRRGPDGE